MSTLEEFFKQGNRIFVAGFATMMESYRISEYATNTSRTPIVPEFIAIGSFFGGKLETDAKAFPGLVTPCEGYCELDIRDTDEVTLFGSGNVPTVARIIRLQAREGVRTLLITSCTDAEAFNRLSRRGRSVNPGYDYVRLHAINEALRYSLVGFHLLPRCKKGAATVRSATG